MFKRDVIPFLISSHDQIALTFFSVALFSAIVFPIVAAFNWGWGIAVITASKVEETE